MNLPKISVVFKTTFLPTGATYYGVHDTTDISFGNPGFSDPYIGNGAKLIALAKQTGNRRSLFNVQALLVGTRAQCEDRLKSLLDNLDYTNPLTLNAVGGWQKGRPQTQAHKDGISQANSVALVGNQNAVGNKGPHIDIDTPSGTKLKWFNNGTQQKMIVCDLNDNPIKPEYKDWKLGKVHRNPHVQKRLEEIKAEHVEETDDE